MLALGIDVGTSGVRTAIVDSVGEIVSGASVGIPAPVRIQGRSAQDPMVWWWALEDCLQRQMFALQELGCSGESIGGIAVDGTSGTMLLADEKLNPCTPGFMYDSGGFIDQAAQIEAVAPADSHGRGAGSGLARALFLLSQPHACRARHLMHQADWIAARLAGRAGFSDQNNVLKTGFDLTDCCWPEWFDLLEIDRKLLPEVFEPGIRVADVSGDIAKRFGFSRDCGIHAGTTDSIAAFLSTGAGEPGDAVTSLGTTLVVKLIADRDVRDSASGVYSHRLGNRWLPGGASNSGGGALLRHFSLEEIEKLSRCIRTENLLGLDYYPLVGVGERFPVCDPKKVSIHEPRPEQDMDFLQALLEGVAMVEKRAYDHLTGLGAPAPRRVFTAGGGASNNAWCKIREKILGLPVITCQESSAAAGSARLILENW